MIDDLLEKRRYLRRLDRCLADDFLGRAMETFAVAYRQGRQAAFAGLDFDALADEVARIKQRAVGRMDQLLERFRRQAERLGTKVHLAADAAEANDIIAAIAAEAGARRVIKSKSMTAEEILLNHHLEAQGLDVTETDLGEWIVQLRGEGPSHMVMPAIHLSRHQVAELFSRVTGRPVAGDDIDRLVKVARRQLRRAFIEADMGISGANFAVADTGTIGLITNEGNGRLVTTLPPVHVALVGLEKLVPTLADALAIARVLPRNATGQAITSYVTWITGAVPCRPAAGGAKQMHVVFLDNGRRALAADPVFSQVLQCVRCGACANVCPVYRMVGGHSFGHIYIGAIGLILTYFFHDRRKARLLVENCINCQACKQVCAAGIDLPALIKQVLARSHDRLGRPLKNHLVSRVMGDRRLFHGLLKTAAKAQQAAGETGPFLRHLPMVLSSRHRFRRLPPLAAVPFRDRWPRVRRQVSGARLKVALFAGCAQDFIYPGHLEAAVDLLADHQVAVDFAPQQTCCGLPLVMMGEMQAAAHVARQNAAAVDARRVDAVVTLCASCASHLTHGYRRMAQGRGDLEARIRALAQKVVPFSVFAAQHLGLQGPAGQGPTVTYHAPCHLCRGLGVRRAPKELIAAAGARLAEGQEEETCCGFGGSYSVSFAQVSARIARRKVDDIRRTGAEAVVTECPGCILQLGGTLAQQRLPIRAMHLVELLAEAAGRPSQPLGKKGEEKWPRKTS